MQALLRNTAPYFRLFLLNAWFGLFLLLITICFANLVITTEKPPNKRYQATLKVQILQLKGTHEQETDTAFFARFFTNPGTLSLILSKHPDLTLKQLSDDIDAMPLAHTNLVLLKAHAATPQKASQLVVDLYQITRQKFIEAPLELKQQIDTGLETELQRSADFTPEQLERKKIINRLLARLKKPDSDQLSLSSPEPDVVDITPGSPNHRLVLLLAAFVGTSLGIEACLRIYAMQKASYDAHKKQTILIWISYTLLALGCTWIVSLVPVVGLCCAVVLQMCIWLFTHIRYALPLYLLLAAPSIGLNPGVTGIFSRIFIGNLLFYLLVLLWSVRSLLAGRNIKKKTAIFHPAVSRSLSLPLLGLIISGVSSLILSRLFPDQQVTYTFAHASIPLSLINLSEMSILIGLPLCLYLVPGLVRTRSSALTVLAAYIGVGLIYALGTILAPSLGLISQETLLGIQRPLIFGAVSSGLGNLITLFACLALGMFFYAGQGLARAGWGLLFCLFALGVLLSLGREAWLALLLAAIVMSGLRNKKWLLLLLPGLILLLALIAPGVTDFFNPQKVYGSDRLAIWQDALMIWQRSPYFGVGAGNYQFFDLSYGSDIVGVAHNQYLEVLAEMGIQGFFCLIWFLIVLGYTLYRYFRTSTTSSGKALALAGLGCYLTIVFGGFFTDTLLPSAAAGGGMGPFITTSYRWLLLGLALSIQGWEKHQLSQDASKRTLEPAPKLSDNQSSGFYARE